MAKEINVKWQEYNGTDYDTLYPKTKAANVAINPTTSLSDVVVYGEPLRYNLSQQSLYFHKNGLLINRQTNNVDMYLSSENKDYADIDHLIDLNGIPTLSDKIADNISGNTNRISTVLHGDSNDIFTFSPNGSGTLSNMSITATMSSSRINGFRIRIYSGNNLLWQSDVNGTLASGGWTSGSEFTVQPNIEVAKNTSYSVRLFMETGTGGITINAGTFALTFTGEVYQSGYFTTKQFTMTDGNKLQTWLYYTGTAPSTSYNVGSGSYTSITPVSVTTSVFMDGTACNVAKYEINGELIKNNVIRFKFDISSPTTIIKEMCGVLL